MIKISQKKKIRNGTFKGGYVPRKHLEACSVRIVSSDFFRSHEPHTRLSAVLTAAFYLRVKDKRLLPPATSGYLQLTMYSSTVSLRKGQTPFLGGFRFS